MGVKCISLHNFSHMGAIRDIINFTNSRLKLKLVNSTDNEIIVSREKVSDFKNWLDR